MGVPSSGSSNFSSTPLNLQNPAFTALAPGVASDFTNLTGGLFGLSGVGANNPFSVNGIPSGSPGNPLVAGMSGNEGGNLSIANDLTTGMVPGGGNNALASGLQTALGFLNPNYPASLASSPQTQAAINAAINPLINTFQQQTIPGITGQFTAAGQRTGGGAGASGTNMSVNDFNQQTGMGQAISGNPGQGSSAFDQARVNAENNLMAQEGAVAGGITNQAYQTGLQQQSNAINQSSALGTQEINNVIQDLQAQALPRLIQQYGINAGLQLYQSQVQSILQSLGLQAQAAQPAIGFRSSGGGSQKGGMNLFNPLDLAQLNLGGGGGGPLAATGGLL